jgi:MFS family permease
VNGGWATLAPGLALLVLGQGILAPTLAAAVADRARVDRRGATLSVQQSVGGVARVVGPVLAGALFQHAGVPVPYVVGAVLAMAALPLVPAGEPEVVAGPPTV